MPDGETAFRPTRHPSEAGKRRLLSRPWEPLFIAEWVRALFLHFEVDPEALQPSVPFELDRHENDRAFVSLVAFTMRDLRPRVGGKPGAWLFRPIATHPFLNVRTYVRHADEPGIHFLAEWLPNRLAVWLGPAVFGLPYRPGKIKYRHEPERGRLAGEVRDTEGKLILEYEGDIGESILPRPCEAGSLNEFLVERYTAFTIRNGRPCFFRVWHEPWPISEVRLRPELSELFERTPGGKAWAAGARFIGAHYSPGAGGVWMSWPHRIRGNFSSTTR